MIFTEIPERPWTFPGYFCPLLKHDIILLQKLIFVFCSNMACCNQAIMIKNKDKK